MICLKFEDRPVTGKCLLTPIEINKLKKSYFHGSLEKFFYLNLAFNDQPIERSVALKHLGLTFVRPHLDYSDIIYNQPLNEYLSNRLESVQYKATLAITGAIQRSS